MTYNVRVPLASLLSIDFLDEYVRKGEFSAFTIDSRIDHSNVVAFLPNGVLILTVDRDTYQSLGLTGRPSKFRSLKSSRYDIVIDFRSPIFQTGKAAYKRLLWCLEDSTDPCVLLATYVRDGCSHPIKFPATPFILNWTAHNPQGLSKRYSSQVCFIVGLTLGMKSDETYSAGLVR